MADQEQEQNRPEEATPFKLRRARERGMVARSVDLGYLGSLIALAAFLTIAGGTLVFQLAQMMRRAIAAGMSGANEPGETVAILGASYWSSFQSIILLGGTIVAIVVTFEIVQMRGLVFSSHPLKPDFTRLNPAKGLKRIFSMRMLKEALKNILKLGAYSAVTFLVIRTVIAEPGRMSTDAQGLAISMQTMGMRLLFMFIGVAIAFAALDQFLVRREFGKQMRMSRREVTREAREREGEPRLKQKRKQLHAEFAKQVAGLGKLPGSDLLVVNPEHVAVALTYVPERMAAPTVTAKAQNHFALDMKQRARRLGIPIFENPPLARRLYQDCQPGNQIDAAHYQDVAALYLQLRGKAANMVTEQDD